MPVTLPDDLLQSTKLTEAELKAELALALFQRERLTLGQAAILAGLPQLDFQRLLASRRIPLHYGIVSRFLFRPVCRDPVEGLARWHGSQWHDNRHTLVTELAESGATRSS